MYVLLSQDEARFPLVPALQATLGVKGHCPTIGTWDNKEQVYCFAALNVVMDQLITRLLEQPARSKAKTGQSKQQRLPGALAAPLRDIARVYSNVTQPSNARRGSARRFLAGDEGYHQRWTMVW